MLSNMLLVSPEVNTRPCADSTLKTKGETMKAIKGTKFVVTRQSYWPDGDNVVEIAEGGIDYCNPDALTAKYSGEFEEFFDPREAVEIAINILKECRKDSGKSRSIRLAIGNTHGMTLPFEHCTIKDARKVAQHIFKSLPKCARCGELIERESFYHELSDGEVFCREYCAEEDYAQYLQPEEEVSL